MPTTQPAPANPLEGVKLGFDFVKQIIALSAQLATLVSGGIYFLVQQHFVVEISWVWAIGLLFLSIVAGMLSLGSFIGQFRRNTLDVNRGPARFLALGQTLLFLGALSLIVMSAGRAISRVPTCNTTAPNQPAAPAADASQRPANDLSVIPSK